LKWILHCTIFGVKAGRIEAGRASHAYNDLMYIIAIGWLYVTLLMAATESSITAGILSFAFYGLAPLALFLWLFGTPQRRRNKAKLPDRE
jgi:hypothetical protein